MKHLNKVKLLFKRSLWAIMAFACNVQSVVAEPQKPSLSAGMSYGDVLKLWGPPNEKIIKETSRAEIWNYQSEQVFLSAGKVNAWTGSNQRTTAEEASEAVAQSKSLQNHRSKDKESNVEVEDILKEIVKESPDEESGPSRSSIHSPPMPVSPNMPMPPPAMPGMDNSLNE